MIIACPACATRYALPDEAIGAAGRTVRCAKCRHSWFQSGPEQPAPPPPAAPVAEPAAPPPSAPPRPAAAVAEAARMPSPEQLREALARTMAAATASQAIPASILPTAPAPAEVAESAPAAETPADEPSYFEHEPPFRPRRNPARLWTAAALIFALLSCAAIAAVARFGLPDWVPLATSGFGPAQPDLALSFPPNRQDRRTLPDGTQFFGITGTVTNIGQQRRAVPTLLILLRDDKNRVVYSWEVTAPKRVLAPGESVPIIEAATDIPQTAKFAEIGWKPA